LTELIADYLPTFCQLVAAQPVVVYRITGQCKTILPSKATATDWLRMLVREEAIISLTQASRGWPRQQGLYATNAPHSLADSDRSHITEQIFFWRYISECHLKDLMERLARLLVPSELEPYGVLALANVHMAECSELLCSRPVQTQDPMGIAMQERGIRTQELYPAIDPYATQLVANNIRKPLAGSIQKTGTEQLRQVLQDIREALHTLNLLYARAPLSSSGRSVEPPRHSHRAYSTDHPIAGGASWETPESTQLTLIRNQEASVPGSHGVLFLRPQKRLINSNTTNTLPVAQPATAPPPTATPRAFSTFLRENNMCFRHAIGTACASST